MNLKHLEELGLSQEIAVLDIETLGKCANAVIASIGCAIKNIYTGDVVGTFYVRCDLKPQLKTRTTDQSTCDWWETQKKEYPLSFNEVFSDKLYRVSLKDALNQLNDFLNLHLPVRPQVIGNGPEFDNVIVGNAMDQAGIKPAWDHGCNQSLRTFVFLGRHLLNIDPKYKLEFKGDRHHALNDAVYEAEYLHFIFKSLLDAIHPNAKQDKKL